MNKKNYFLHDLHVSQYSNMKVFLPSLGLNVKGVKGVLMAYAP